MQSKKSLVFSTGFVSLIAGSTGEGLHVPYDRSVAELFKRYNDDTIAASRDITFLQSAISSAKRLIGDDLVRFFEDQLHYGRLDGMRLLFLEDTIKTWTRLLYREPTSYSFIRENKRYVFRDISIEQWCVSVSRTRVYSTANHDTIIKNALEKLREFRVSGANTKTERYLIELLAEEQGLNDLVKSLYIMFGQEVIISHPAVRSAKNPATQALVDNLKQLV